MLFLLFFINKRDLADKSAVSLILLILLGQKDFKGQMLQEIEQKKAQLLIKV